MGGGGTERLGARSESEEAEDVVQKAGPLFLLPVGGDGVTWG